MSDQLTTFFYPNNELVKNSAVQGMSAYNDLCEHAKKMIMRVFGLN